MFTNLGQKRATKFECVICDYVCCKKYDYDRHLTTRKHEILTNTYKKGQKSAEIKNYVCECGREYKHRQSLYHHKKTCIPSEKSYNNENKEEDDIMKYLLKENTELKNMIIDVCKNLKPSDYTNYSHNMNSNNKTFNLQVFLNETCKDAMNLMDFVDSVQIQLTDLENVGKNGFVEGITDIIINNLKSLDITMRPIHCSDQKREVIYVKDNNLWINDSKEQPSNQKLKNAIKKIVHKNICLIPEWKAKYPDCIFSESKKSDLYNHIMYESMDNNNQNSEKIIKKIAKEMVIDKNHFI